MEKEKQIDEMAKLICTYPHCVNYNNIGGCQLNKCQIADNAENLYNAGYRKVEQGEWISVDDRLPKPCEDVLVFNEDGEIEVGFAFRSEGIDWYSRKITHWMPLPQPPKMKGAE